MDLLIRVCATLYFFSISTYCLANYEFIETKDFAEPPQIFAPKLSPDGTRMVFAGVNDGSRYLVVAAIGEEPKKNKVLRRINLDGKYIQDYFWVSDERLLLEVQSIKSLETEYYSIGAEKTAEPTFRLRGAGTPVSDYAVARLISLLENDPDHVLMYFGYQVFEGNRADRFIQIVNINTGGARIHDDNQQFGNDLIVDKNGNIRIMVERISYKHFTRLNIYHRFPGQKKWKRIERHKYLDEDAIEPYRFEENGELLVYKVRDALSVDLDLNKQIPLYRYDLKSRKIIGVYKNEEHDELEQLADSKWPLRNNVVVSSSSSNDRHIVVSYSDVVPAQFYIVDSGFSDIRFIGGRYPHFRGKEFAQAERINYMARDGLDIPGFITYPANNDQQPALVVMPHDGPFSSEKRGFDPFVQFLVNRGYAVFQPQYRGSLGFGFKHAKSGYGELGSKIQSDIADGVKWLVENRKVDKEKICVIGEGMGAYTAMLEASKSAKNYKCAIGINGLYDIKSHLRNSNYRRKDRLGRPLFEDYKRLSSKSPAELAGELTASVMLIAESRSTGKNQRNAREFHKKLVESDADASYVELVGVDAASEGGSRQYRLYSAVEDFLKKHLN